jgi:hypothetical protein
MKIHKDRALCHKFLQKHEFKKKEKKENHNKRERDHCHKLMKKHNL